MVQKFDSRVVLLLVLLLIGVFFVLPMLGMFMWIPMMRGGMMSRWGFPDGYGLGYPMRWEFMFIGMLVPLAFIGILIVGAYFMLTSRRETIGNENALRILDERYAKGEITGEQYSQMKQNLTKK
jgi:uncharacterized membrane protein